MQTNVSVLLSCILAVAWANPPSAEKKRPGQTWAWLVLEALQWCVGWLHALNQVLPWCLLWYAANSLRELCSAVVTIHQAPAGNSRPQWMSTTSTETQRYALAMALMLWRAEKLESLLQRMKRSTKALKTSGFKLCFTKALASPKLWIWSPFWAISRRVALVAISTFGCIPFVRTAFPAVALDEFLNVVVAQAQDVVNRKVVTLPLVFSIGVAPLLDLIYFFPGALQVVLLGCDGYARYEVPTPMAYALIASTVAWTGHNCNLVHTTLCVDVPDALRQWWAAWRG
mmetsp:Transcript_58875/g.137550  ORF Transcript_58875/g.137550 Transcript_58875/m.137550 type:complete len:285 (+) Transcript_58875:114-968(+)